LPVYGPLEKERQSSRAKLGTGEDRPRITVTPQGQGKGVNHFQNEKNFGVANFNGTAKFGKRMKTIRRFARQEKPEQGEV